jgi:hypothetical protein
MKNFFLTLLSLSSIAGPMACDDADECEARRLDYYAAVEAAQSCDPALSTPCAEYRKVECAPLGVAPDSMDALNSHFADYKDAGCALPVHRCPIFVNTPPPYTCQAAADGNHRCFSICEQVSTAAHCVVDVESCAGLVIPTAFCAGESVCCSS